MRRQSAKPGAYEKSRTRMECSSRKRWRTRDACGRRTSRKLPCPAPHGAFRRARGCQLLQAGEQAGALEANLLDHRRERVPRPDGRQSGRLRQHVHRVNLADGAEHLDHVGSGHHVPAADAGGAERLRQGVQHHQVVALLEQRGAACARIGELAVRLVDHHEARACLAHRARAKSGGTTSPVGLLGDVRITRSARARRLPAARRASARRCARRARCARPTSGRARRKTRTR